MKKNFLTGLALILIFAASSHAAKWETLVFNEDLNLGLVELDKYCMLHDISVHDVLWANSIASSADIKAGTSIYLPENQTDLLAIWQNQGAWKPAGLIPVNSAAAAKKIAVEHEKKLEAKQEKEKLEAQVPPHLSGHVTPMEKNFIDPKESAELQEKLEDFMKVTEAPKLEAKTDAKAEPKKIENKIEAKSATAKVNPKFPEIITDMKIEHKETPQDAIAKMAKPDKNLLEKPKKSSASASKSNSNTNTTDPIIVLSPNGDYSSQGPMRLLIVGDKVEVVRIPEKAAPKNPSVTDLDHVFGTYPSYLPYEYNFNDLPKNNNFTLNLKNLGGKMMWPVDGKVSSHFGKRGSRMHEGIDIPMPEGTPIRAARNGVVARTGNNATLGFRGYGNFVLLDHGGKLESFYAHCSKVAVKPGQRVMQGQIIAYVGNTGRSTANHLHFEVRMNNIKVDPMPYLSGKTQLASRKQKSN